MYSLKSEIRFIVKTTIADYKYVESVCDLYPSANWLEREAWDLFVCYF